MSGAGRSSALRILEDLGFYCVDNLPPALIPELVEKLVELPSVHQVALGIDTRTGLFLANTTGIRSAIEKDGHHVQILFLDAIDSALVKRFSETRRPHPLAKGGNVLEALQSERETLSDLRNQADLIVDTSRLSVHDLKRTLVGFTSQGELGGKVITPRLSVRVLSFGFRFGVPIDADWVVDVRHLPNPHFIPELKPHSGLESQVSSFVLAQSQTQALLAHLVPMFDMLIPEYHREGKAYLTIAFGCTAGRHRSVAMAEHLSQHLCGHRDLGRVFSVTKSHRDVERQYS